MTDEIIGRWTVTEIDGASTIVGRPEVDFSSDGRISGTAGINRIMGSYEK